MGLNVVKGERNGKGENEVFTPYRCRAESPSPAPPLSRNSRQTEELPGRDHRPFLRSFQAHTANHTAAIATQTPPKV